MWRVTVIVVFLLQAIASQTAMAMLDCDTTHHGNTTSLERVSHDTAEPSRAATGHSTQILCCCDLAGHCSTAAMPYEPVPVGHVYVPADNRMSVMASTTTGHFVLPYRPPILTA